MGDSKVAVGVVGNCMGVWGNCGEATEAAVGVATEAGAASVGVPVILQDMFKLGSFLSEQCSKKKPSQVLLMMAKCIQENTTREQKVVLELFSKLDKNLKENLTHSIY